MSETTPRAIPRHVVEAATALATGAVGLLVCKGALDIGAGWTPMGPDAGYFPFYIGLAITGGSLINLIAALVCHRRRGEVFITTDKLAAVASFVVPIVAFTLVSVMLGLYVGTALYIAGTMTFQGHYRWWVALAGGLAVSVLFFLIFELGFQVPLLKGPVEAWFGIY